MGKEPAVERETLDRVRRIETRLTKLGQAMGVDVGGGQPMWDTVRGVAVVPTPNCSIKGILAVIPQGYRERGADVYVGDEYLMTVRIDP